MRRAEGTASGTGSHAVSAGRMRRFAAGALLALACVPAGAGDDLLSLFREAQKTDATFQSAQAAYQAAREKLPQGEALLYPTATLSAATNWNDRRIDFRGLPASVGQFNSNSLSVTLTQPLYRPQNNVQVEQARVQVSQAEAVLAQAAQDLAVRLAQAYFDVLLAEDNVALAGAQKAAIRQQLEQAKRNFEVGTATITDTHEAQARFDLTSAQEIAARNDLEIRRRTLQQIIGRDAGAVAKLAQKVEVRLPEPPDMEKWVAEAEAGSYAVVIARFAMEVAQKEIERNRLAHRPTLDAVASYTESAVGAGPQGGVGSDTSTKVLGLQLAIPLYQGGLVQSRIREALATAEKARYDLEAQKRTSALAARQSYLGVTNGIEQVRALETALVSTQSQLESTRLGQEVGVRTGVDVLNAQQQLYSARRDLAQATYNTVLNQLRLKAAVARLSEEDITTINRWLDPSSAGIRR